MIKVIAVLFLINLASCQNEFFVKVNAVDQDTTFNIQTNVKRPSVLVMHVIANLDDTCKISGHKIPPKIIDTILHSDWYDSTLSIKYEPYKAKTGMVKVGYQLN